MIDPNNITNYWRSQTSLLEFWLFCLFVRGKNATVQATKLSLFLENIEKYTDNAWWQLLPCLYEEDIEEYLRQIKSGQYKTLAKAINVTLDRIADDPLFLQHATTEELEEIPGVGPKTARFFILHTRKNAEVAVLDVHIMRFLSLMLGEELPRGTPASAGLYTRLEKEFLRIAAEEKVAPADMDLAIWRASREGSPMRWRAFL